MVWGLLNEIIRAGSVDCGHLVVEAASRVGAGEDIHSRP
jgi:hypothetical protein